MHPPQTTLIGDIRISRMGFGAMRITGKAGWGWPKDRRRVAKVLAKARELGIQLIDTADAYGPETSEYLLEENLYPYTDLCIATKGGMQRSGPRSWIQNGHPDHLRIACHNSLRRLRVSCIDLYQLHAVDSKVPLEESLGALQQLQHEGKIRHIGVSNMSVEELRRARAVATIVSVQNQYNLLKRDHDEMVDYCEKHQLAFIAWAPLQSGHLTRDERLTEIAQNHKATTGQIALSYLLHRSPAMVPIPGTCSVRHLETNTRSQTLRLTPDEIQDLDSIR